ncbi:hypothetical protein BC831DRAFT_253288 [Entophlyctis helioformis]|nr:hypothetical protein BC831DRAFT_253288 [Entophlyctis helioformis]
MNGIVLAVAATVPEALATVIAIVTTVLLTEAARTSLVDAMNALGRPTVHRVAVVSAVRALAQGLARTRAIAESVPSPRRHHHDRSRRSQGSSRRHRHRSSSPSVSPSRSRGSVSRSRSRSRSLSRTRSPPAKTSRRASGAKRHADRSRSRSRSRSRGRSGSRVRARLASPLAPVADDMPTRSLSDPKAASSPKAVPVTDAAVDGLYDDLMA